MYGDADQRGILDLPHLDQWQWAWPVRDGQPVAWSVPDLSRRLSAIHTPLRVHRRSLWVELARQIVWVCGCVQLAAAALYMVVLDQYLLR